MEKQRHGGDIYSRKYRLDFSASINPLGMPENARRAAEEGLRQCSHYPDTQWRELRSALSAAENVPADQILCSNGAAELIYALCAAKRPGKAVLIAPGFGEYEEALRLNGCQITFYTCREEDGFAVKEDILNLLTEETDILFACTPDNPTGISVPEQLLRRMADRCRRKDILFVLDECFAPLMDETFRFSLKDLLPEIPQLFILGALTKMYSMAGLRLGYGLCTDQKLLRLVRSYMQPWNVSVPAQMAGIEALKDRKYVRRTQELFAAAKPAFRQQLESLGLKVYPSEANFLFFRGPQDLYEKCRERGILIRDCSGYRGLGPGFFRAAVRLPEENAELIRTLKEIFKC